MVEEQVGLVVQLGQGEISTNIEILREKLLKLAAEYDGLVVTRDYVAQAKNDRAYLNSVAKQLDAERIRVKKEFMQPIEAFEAEVKSLLAPVKEASANIDRQVKEFEENEKVEKRRLIEEHWRGCAGILADVVDFDAVFDPKWLNVSVKLGIACKEVDSVIERIAREEQALTELGLAYADEAKAEYFRTLDFAAAVERSKQLVLSEERARQFEADKAEILARQEEARAAQQAASDKEAAVAFPEPALSEVFGEPQPERSTWVMVVEDATREDIQKLGAFCKTLGLTGKAHVAKEGEL